MGVAVPRSDIAPDSFDISLRLSDTSDFRYLRHGSPERECGVPEAPRLQEATRNCQNSENCETSDPSQTRRCPPLPLSHHLPVPLSHCPPARRVVESSSRPTSSRRTERRSSRRAEQPSREAEQSSGLGVCLGPPGGRSGRGIGHGGHNDESDSPLSTAAKPSRNSLRLRLTPRLSQRHPASATFS